MTIRGNMKKIILAILVFMVSEGVARGQNEIPFSQLSVQFVDSQEVGYEAKLAIDGDPATMWATSWIAANPPYPHEIVLSLNGSYLLYGIGYQARQDGIPNGNVGKFEVYLSQDGQTFTLAGNGTFTNTLTVQTWNLPIPAYAKFIKFKGLDVVPESTDDKTTLVAAELKVYKYNGTTFTVRPGEPWIGSAMHDGSCTVGYRMYANDVVISTQPVANLINGIIQLPGNLKLVGYYQIKISAYTMDMCGITADEKFSESVVLLVEQGLSTPGIPSITKGPFGNMPVPTPPAPGIVVTPTTPPTAQPAGGLQRPDTTPQPKPRILQVPPKK